jgi:hypothetical protein
MEIVKENRLKLRYSTKVYLGVTALYNGAYELTINMNAMVARLILYEDNIFFLRNSDMVFEWLQHHEFAATWPKK